jgi:hypothetical protein
MDFFYWQRIGPTNRAGFQNRTKHETNRSNEWSSSRYRRSTSWELGGCLIVGGGDAVGTREEHEGILAVEAPPPHGLTALLHAEDTGIDTNFHVGSPSSGLVKL